MIFNSYRLLKIFSLIFLIFNFSHATEIKILKKINNEIITNVDVELEYNYLVALNNDLKNVAKNEGLKIAEDSLLREKIKLNEIKKNFLIENFKDKELLNNILISFYKQLNLKDELEFNNYLQNFGLNINEVKDKIKIEVLWNQLIGQKYMSQINIDEQALKKKIKKDKLNFVDVIEYDLSEIVFQAKDQKELESKINEIKLNIDMNGFSAAANRFSTANSSKFGGKIGKVKENQLSNQIQKELNKINIGEISNPINIGSGFIILYINDKKISKLEENEDDLLKKMIQFEKAKQFDQFSLIYFNKVKINTIIKSD